jgi:hypothetical protein
LENATRVTSADAGVVAVVLALVLALVLVPAVVFVLAPAVVFVLAPLVAIIAAGEFAIANPPVPTGTSRPPCSALAHATRRSAPIAPGRQTRIRFLAERDCRAFQLR